MAGMSCVPTFRVDLLREVDLIEEVGRHYGFERLEPAFPIMTEAAPPPDPRIARDQLVRRALTAAGLSEAVTFGFIEADAARAFAPGFVPAYVPGLPCHSSEIPRVCRPSRIRRKRTI